MGNVVFKNFISECQWHSYTHDTDGRITTFLVRLC